MQGIDILYQLCEVQICQIQNVVECLMVFFDKFVNSCIMYSD